MRTEVHAQSRELPTRLSPAPGGGPGTALPPLTLQVDRLDIEGLGSLHPGHLHEGFREGCREQQAVLENWVASGGQPAPLSEGPLELVLPPAAGAREAGRRLAHALLKHLTDG